MTDGDRPLSNRIAIGWSAGAFGQAIAIYAFGVLLFRYLTDEAAIGAALVGTLIAISKVYDAVVDPLVGHFSDRIETPMGRRRPWILVGGIMLGASIAVLFNVPIEASPTFKIIWTSLGLLLFSTGYSLFAIPWMAMPAEMTSDSGRRTTMMAWRIGFASAGQGAGAVAGPLFLSALGSGALGYGRMGLILGGLCLLTSILSVALTRDAPSLLREHDPRVSLYKQTLSAFRSRPFASLALLMCMLYFGGAVHSGAMAIFTKRVLLLSDAWLGSYYLCLLGAMLASQPLWLAGARRFGKINCLYAALAGQVALQSLLFLAAPGLSPIVLVTQGALAGVAAGGVFMLTQAMLPDVIEFDHHANGVQRSGTFSGVISLVDTGALALGVLVLGLFLSSMGYLEGLGANGRQPDSALLGVRLAVSFIPAATALVCLMILGRYPLRDDEAQPGIGHGRCPAPRVT